MNTKTPNTWTTLSAIKPNEDPSALTSLTLRAGLTNPIFRHQSGLPHPPQNQTVLERNGDIKQPKYVPQSNQLQNSYWLELPNRRIESAQETPLQTDQTVQYFRFKLEKANNHEFQSSAKQRDDNQNATRYFFNSGPHAATIHHFPDQLSAQPSIEFQSQADIRERLRRNIREQDFQKQSFDRVQQHRSAQITQSTVNRFATHNEAKITMSDSRLFSPRPTNSADNKNKADQMRGTDTIEPTRSLFDPSVHRLVELLRNRQGRFSKLICCNQANKTILKADYEKLKDQISFQINEVIHQFLEQSVELHTSMHRGRNRQRIFQPQIHYRMLWVKIQMVLRTSLLILQKQKLLLPSLRVTFERILNFLEDCQKDKKEPKQLRTLQNLFRMRDCLLFGAELSPAVQLGSINSCYARAEWSTRQRVETAKIVKSEATDTLVGSSFKLQYSSDRTKNRLLLGSNSNTSLADDDDLSRHYLMANCSKLDSIPCLKQCEGSQNQSSTDDLQLENKKGHCFIENHIKVPMSVPCLEFTQTEETIPANSLSQARVNQPKKSINPAQLIQNNSKPACNARSNVHSLLNTLYYPLKVGCSVDPKHTHKRAINIALNQLIQRNRKTINTIKSYGKWYKKTAKRHEKANRKLLCKGNPQEKQKCTIDKKSQQNFKSDTDSSRQMKSPQRQNSSTQATGSTSHKSQLPKKIVSQRNISHSVASRDKIIASLLLNERDGSKKPTEDHVKSGSMSLGQAPGLSTWSQINYLKFKQQPHRGTNIQPHSSNVLYDQHFILDFGNKLEHRKPKTTDKNQRNLIHPLSSPHIQLLNLGLQTEQLQFKPKIGPNTKREQDGTLAEWKDGSTEMPSRKQAFRSPQQIKSSPNEPNRSPRSSHHLSMKARTPLLSGKTHHLRGRANLSKHHQISQKGKKHREQETPKTAKQRKKQPLPLT